MQGTHTQITGINFPNILGTDVDLELWNEEKTEMFQLDTVETLSDGSFLHQITVPAVQSGDYYLKASSLNDHIYAWTTFTVGEPPLDWWIDLDLSLGQAQSSLRIGETLDATYAFDTTLSEAVAPPNPPAGINAYIYYPNNPKSPADLTRLTTSYHPVEYPNEWNITLSSISVSGTMTLNWDPIQTEPIPLEYDVLLKTNTEYIDMRTVETYQWEVLGSSSKHLKIIVSESLTHTYSFTTGWNMFSLPVQVIDSSTEAIFSSIPYFQVLSWDGVEYSVASTIEPGQGYWVLVLEDYEVQVTGPVAVLRSVTINPGWNLVGASYQTLDVSSLSSSYYMVVGWDGFSYTSEINLTPGSGYWMLVLEETEIHFE